ncbi:MAG: hypothetical protein RI953_3033 [Pseudomonadota bacterium]
MTALSRALNIAAIKNTSFARQKHSLAIDKNISALRNFGSTRFVMIEMGSMG